VSDEIAYFRAFLIFLNCSVRSVRSSVTSAWTRAVRASGRTPLYSTSWSNTAALSVAAKLKLVPYASWWSVV
jgi:hypothetical protein